MTPRNSSRPRLIPSLGLLAVLALAVGTAGCGSGSSSTGTSAARHKAAAGDHSIQEYGVEAAVSERAQILSAMHSFVLAMASRNYSGICAGLAASIREQIARLQPGAGCAATLTDLVNPAVVRAAKSTSTATIKKVRIDEGDAFVLFRPAGGTLSYLVLKHEGASWKAISLAPGTPLDADATP